MVTLKPISPAVVADFRAVRLGALLDTPWAFGSTQAKEAQLSDADWERRAAEWNGERSVGLLAYDGAEACGIVAAFLDRADPAKAHLISMWVAPTHRKRGVGRLLVNAAIDWARRGHVRTLFLMVTSKNDVAMRFYERLGFARTGRIGPYPNDATLVEYEMARAIERDGATSP